MVDVNPVGQRATASRAPDLTNELKSQLDFQEKKTNQAVQFRRYQRWFFYVIFVLLFVGAVGLAVKAYNDNSKLLADINTINLALNESKTNLDKVEADLSTKERALQATDANLQEVQAELLIKTEELDLVAEKNQILESQLDQANLDLDYASANVANLILELAIKLDTATLQKIALADVEPDTLDSDDDGLADQLELAIGTDLVKADSDEDGYTDKQEIIGGFNPVGQGNLSLDNGVANKYKGRVLLQDNTYAWYIGQNGKKYFLGTITDRFTAMRLNQYWSRSN